MKSIQEGGNVHNIQRVQRVIKPKLLLVQRHAKHTDSMQTNTE